MFVKFYTRCWGYRAKRYGTGEGQSFESMALAHGHGDLDHPENPSGLTALDGGMAALRKVMVHGL